MTGLRAVTVVDEEQDALIAAGGRGASAENSPSSPSLQRYTVVSRLKRAARHCWEHEPLLLATLAGVLFGVVLGTALSFAHLSPMALDVIGLPGDILMRLLKMLVLPLITASVMAGVCALRQSAADMGKVARYTLLYYFTTTMGAVVLGIIIVNVVQPGRGSPFDQLDPEGGGDCHKANQAKVTSHATSAAAHSPGEAFLSVIRSAFPDNVFAAAYNMNVLGIITASLLLGAALSSMGPEAAPMVDLVNTFNEAIGKVVGWVIWTSPVGIASLITTSICRACNLGATLVALGLFIVAVLIGLLVWGFLVLPAIYYATTRRNPMQVYRGFSQAMVTAFGTDSSNATLPITMRSATDNLGCDPRIVQFFLPLGTTVNMNGTALYEAVTVIFIAQAHGVALGAAGTLIVALTATLAAVGAAGIPSAGLVTMLMVLQAVELEQFAGDIAVILAVDWFLDRCRTVVNVLGDSFGTVIIDHHARKWIIGGKAATHGEDAAGAAHPPIDALHAKDGGAVAADRWVGHGGKAGLEELELPAVCGGRDASTHAAGDVSASGMVHGEYGSDGQHGRLYGSNGVHHGRHGHGYGHAHRAGAQHGDGGDGGGMSDGLLANVSRQESMAAGGGELLDVGRVGGAGATHGSAGTGVRGAGSNSSSSGAVAVGAASGVWPHAPGGAELHHRHH